MSKIWVVPDIHGRYDLLTSLMDTLTESGKHSFKTDKLIFLGDYVDRGPQSAQVLDILRILKDTYPENVIVLYGNHEDLMINGCTRGGYDWDLWMMNGGGATQRSYAGSKVPDDVLKWVASLPLSHKEPGFFFSHAPVPREEDRHSTLQGEPFSRSELTWTYNSPEGKYARDFKEDDNEYTVGVCGHVHALRSGILEPRFYDHYIFADAGCGCSPKAPLVAIEVKSREVIYAWPAEAMGTHS